MYSQIADVRSQWVLPILVLSLCVGGCRSSPHSAGESSLVPELPALIDSACWAEVHYRRSLDGRLGAFSVEAVIVPDMNTHSLLIVMVPMRHPLPSFSTYEGRMFIDEELIEAESAVNSIQETSGRNMRIRISWCTPLRYRSESHNSTDYTSVER